MLRKRIIAGLILALAIAGGASATEYVGVSSAWKAIVGQWVGVGGSWKLVENGWVGVGGVWKLYYTAFTPVTHTYTPGSPGTGSETVPSGSQHLTLTIDGGGGGGMQGDPTMVPQLGDPGGGAARVIETIAISSSDWGHTLSYVLGAAGISNNDGTGSTATGTLAAGSFSLDAGPGMTDGSGGTASGGTTNTNGSDGNFLTGAGGQAGSGAAGGAPGDAGKGGANGSSPGAGGGASDANYPGGTGGNPQASFAWS